MFSSPRRGCLRAAPVFSPGHVTWRGGRRSSIWTAEVAFPEKLIRRIEKQTTVPEIVQTLPLPLGCHLSSRLVLRFKRVWSRSAVVTVIWQRSRPPAVTRALTPSGNFLRPAPWAGVSDRLPWTRCSHDGPFPPAQRPGGSDCRRGNAAPPTGPESHRSDSTWWRSS